LLMYNGRGMLVRGSGETAAFSVRRLRWTAAATMRAINRNSSHGGSDG
jgi:hypothetical protein